MSNQPQPLAQRLARPELLELEVYQSARRIGGRGDIWINANESPFNNSDLANINRYPECQPPALISAYSLYSGVSVDSIITSRGADEAIELLIRTFCNPGIDSIACFGPTYGMYAISAKTFNIRVKALNLTPEYQLPSDIVSQTQGAKIVFICNPNNPTGTVIDKADIEQVIKQLPNTIVVVDEAYIEFCPEYSVAQLIEKYDNLVVLRTLSKAFALAGARCGFLMASPQICDMVMRVIAPYPVPLPVSQMATAALSEDGISLMREQVSSLKACGARLSDALQSIGAKVQPANGNFVLAEFDSSKVSHQLQIAGIVARAYKDPRLTNCIRFSFSDQADTDALINVLTQ
ncbi:histidinol-phosphate transaminase [Shewanella sp. D64]|uniref:histidinol-phosphate transaminase n=1 Tax=unclassified Shewanella TaxID=196818 RepID=UPI0022BA1678|nr:MULTISPECIES: histidinol-phosphate transaminase [unclassified Shewanella]MEC4724924.1 histidinol-phosphate transaminase [Shewanella sp. D64]MEC4736283.1 histidinol-phosphate transaminase [Shewanella sp. E94]WBJ97653.1 histidinol-phosphate transaminase [Shewanella sp. MTB7]